MAVFPVLNNAVQLNTATPTSADQFSNGIRLKADNSAVFAALSGGGQYQNGFLLDANGAVICVDATSGLPAGTQYTNGLPISPAGALCVSTGAVDQWINGLPFAANGTLVAAGLGDPFYQNVVLLLHFDGANGGTTFTDNSPTPKTASVFSATTSTAVLKYGTASGLFNGSGYISFADSPDWWFGTGNFTIELWYRPIGDANAFWGIVGQAETASVQNAWKIITLNNTTGLVFQCSETGTSNQFSMTMTNAMAIGQWYHVAVTRSGADLYGFIDGVLKATLNIGAATSLFDSTSPVRIGLQNTTYGQFYADDLRITKGVARYVSDFTPPTAAFPNS